jgi:hypothetical protein
MASSSEAKPKLENEIILESSELVAKVPILNAEKPISLYFILKAASSLKATAPA